MKQTLKITGSDELPEVIFDKEKNEFKITGRSLPEDSFSFYKPIIAWLEDYLKNPNSVTHFQIFLEYFNSSSVKQVFFLLSKLEILVKNGKEVKIIWHYKSGDELMKTKGIEFSKLLNVPFEMIEHHK
jgi:hypothetical protein